jgi:hypothetical protein
MGKPNLAGARRSASFPACGREVTASFSLLTSAATSGIAGTQREVTTHRRDAGATRAIEMAGTRREAAAGLVQIVDLPGFTAYCRLFADIGAYLRIIFCPA